MNIHRHGCLNRDSYPRRAGACRRARNAGLAQAVPSTLDPVIRFFGSVRSRARSLKNTFAAAAFHSTTEPTLVVANCPNGTVVEIGFLSANATETSWDNPVPWSTVSTDAAPLAAGITANGLISVPADVILA